MDGGWTFAALSGALLARVAIAGALALTALYLLRRRPRRVVVPFIGLWSASGISGRSERLARRLRRLFSLAVQLAILALILGAAGDPTWTAGGAAAKASGGRTVVLLLDRSASMQARDEVGSGSRFQRARALARRLVDGLDAGDRMAVLGFAGDVTAETGFEDRRERLAAAVDGLRPIEETGNLGGALAFAAAWLRGQPHPVLILISDGASADVDDPAVTAALRGIDVRFAPVGRRRDNVAIVAFSARRLPADPSSVEVSLAVQSFRATPATVTLALVAGPQRVPIGRRTIALAPDARVATTWERLALPDARLEAVLEDARDDLPLDDRAYAVVPEPERAKVLVAGGRNLYLEGALLGLGRAVEVEHVAPAAVEASRARWAAADVVIFDGVTPDPAPTRGAYLYIDPRGPGSPWPVRGTVPSPVVTSVAKDHPLVRHLGLRDLNVASARALVAGPDDVVVASALGRPLLVARPRAGLGAPDRAPLRARFRAIGLAFEINRSDLPLRSAFPLLLANAIAWLGDRPATAALAWPTGRTVRLDVPARLEGDLEVVAPDHTRRRAPVVGGAVAITLDRAGIFDVVAEGGRTVARVAASLASPAESDLGPRPALLVAGHALAPPDLRPAARSWWARWAHRPLATALLLGALLLALAEWVTFHRRLTV